MPVFHPVDAARFSVHGSTFDSFASTARGSQELCAWRLTVPANLPGAAHRPSQEEVLLVLSGELRITLDGATSTLGAGAVAVIPAGAEFRVDGTGTEATAWVTTRTGLQATMTDGTTMSPPWAQ